MECSRPPGRGVWRICAVRVAGGSRAVDELAVALGVGARHRHPCRLIRFDKSMAYGIMLGATELVMHVSIESHLNRIASAGNMYAGRHLQADRHEAWERQGKWPRSIQRGAM